ncbi:unnamed protein product [Ilex paraguariensis]|uniref:F-box domain-containing protein n=1 Tax=Ilex paraguariensis TaxID=185542 RepID=A0ABC8UP27_9AQUA
MASKRIPTAQTVAGDNDLLTEILLRLPIRPLLRFKSVSKHWLSLITNPHFCRRRSRAPSGLFLRRRPNLINPEYDFIPLEDTSPTKPPFGTLTFSDDRHGFNADCKYYIYNPTTHQFSTLPIPSGRGFWYSRGVGSVYAVNLAFDPSKSPHYKAVCVYNSQILPLQFSIEVYSSQTGLWSRSGDPFSSDVNFGLGVFWKGAINWVSRRADSLYFDVDEERLGKMPMPPLRDGREERRLRYFGESGDHLHLIEIYGPHMTQFSVYEMDN